MAINEITTPTAIATIEDRTGGNPLDIQVAIEPAQNLNGYDSPWVGGAGKNKFDISNIQDVFRGYTNKAYHNAYGSYSFTSTPTSSSLTLTRTNDSSILFLLGYFTSGTTVTFSASSITGMPWRLRLLPSIPTEGTEFVSTIIQQNAESATSVKSQTMTLNANGYLYFSCFKSLTSENITTQTINNPQVELGSTATAWSPYSNVCPITGFTEAKITRAGKNLLPNGLYNYETVYTNNGITFTRNADGSVTTIGTASANTFYTLCDGYVFKAGSYRLSGGVSANAIISLRLGTTGGTQVAASSGAESATFTFAEDTACGAIIRIASGTTVNDTFYPMLRLADSESGYEPYYSTTYPISFTSAGTVYGGILDLNSGLLTVDRRTDTYTATTSSSSVTNANGYVAAFGYEMTIPDLNKLNLAITNKAIYSTKNIDRLNATEFRFAPNNAQTWCMLYIIIPGVTTAQECNNYLASNPLQICFYLANPITYQLTPIQVSTILNQNNICSDTGNINYLKGGYTFHDKLTSPVTQNDAINKINELVDDYKDVANAGMMSYADKEKLENLDATYLPLAGGTMTGKLILLGSQYNDNYTSGALDLNNSNIQRVNSIYTADNADNAQEGIHFYRTSTTVDSIHANNGALYFTPNRTLGTVGTSYAIMHDGRTMSANLLAGGYLNIHPENSPVLIPFMHNDIAFLTAIGGSCVIKYDGTEQSIDSTSLFDGSPTYFYMNPTGITTITIELTLHRTFTYGNYIYVDFGSAGWRSKYVNIEYMTPGASSWTQLHRAESNSSGHVYCYYGFSSTGFNKLRFTFSDWNSATIFRIAQIGVVNYASYGLRQPFMSRGIDDLIYRHMTPGKNATYDLGSSSYKWRNIYGNLTGNVTGTASGNLPLSGGTMNNSSKVYFPQTSGSETGIEVTNASTGAGILVGIGAGQENRGIYDRKLSKWMIYADASNIYVNGNATTATTATNVSTNGAATNSTARHIWFSDSGTETRRAHDDNFKYTPSTNTISANISGNAATATSATSATSATTATKANGLTTARAIDGVLFQGVSDITHYGYCQTAAGTGAKAVQIVGFNVSEIPTGSRVIVKFQYTNTAAVNSLTLSINNGSGANSTAKSIKYRGANLPSTDSLWANGTYEFIYDGTNWELVGELDVNPASYETMYLPYIVAGTSTTPMVITPSILKQAIELLSGMSATTTWARATITDGIVTYTSGGHYTSGRHCYVQTQLQIASGKSVSANTVTNILSGMPAPIGSLAVLQISIGNKMANYMAQVTTGGVLRIRSDAALSAGANINITGVYTIQ